MSLIQQRNLNSSREALQNVPEISYRRFILKDIISAVVSHSSRHKDILADMCNLILVLYKIICVSEHLVYLWI